MILLKKLAKRAVAHLTHIKSVILFGYDCIIIQNIQSIGIKEQSNPTISLNSNATHRKDKTA